MGYVCGAQSRFGIFAVGLQMAIKLNMMCYVTEYVSCIII